LNDLPQNASDSNQVQGNIFSFRGEGFAAEMYISASGEFVVRQGSRARFYTTKTIPKGTVALREALIKRKILKEDGDALVFNCDYIFFSVSSSAAVVTGASANGRISWRLPDGRTYADWEVSQTDDAELSRK
jgi:hypothetical protein